MSIFLGNNEISLSGIDSVYLGNTQVYSSIEISDLCFTAVTSGSTISMSINGTPTLGQNFQYSLNKSTWNTFTPGTTTITLPNIGSKVWFRGNNPNGINEGNDYAISTYYQFVMSGSISASGNLMSLIDNGQCTTTTIPNNHCFSFLFYQCASLISTPLLPAATLKSSCYAYMFMDCTSLETATELPATTIPDYAYRYMFAGCQSLITAPALPAQNIGINCYGSMFDGCSSITQAPALPATTLAYSCYSQMFANCRSLIAAPALPAQSVSSYCYEEMFYNCTSLTTVPKLYPTIIGNNCYAKMFSACTALQVSDTQTSAAPYAWNIPQSGTFVSGANQYNMFAACAGTRSSNNLPGASGSSYTYYTQNQPV